MTVLRRATDQQQSEWTPLPGGLWRFVLREPVLAQSVKYGGYQVRFPMSITDTEQERLEAEFGPPADGTQQSWQSSYFTPLKLGWVDKATGQYQSTKLIDMLAACLGQQSSKKFLDWIGSGGGPPRPEDLDDDKTEIALIGDWLKWWEDLQVYGTITHKPAANGQIWANFSNPIAIGSLPGQKDEEYQAHGRGKLRSIIAESHPELVAPAVVQPAQRRVAVAERPPAVQYSRTGQRVAAPQEEDDSELPF